MRSRRGPGRWSLLLQALAALCVLLMLGGRADAGPFGRVGQGTVFVDLVDHPVPEGNWDRFHHLQDHLAADFFRVCAERRCAPGAWLWPLQLRCSVDQSAGRVAACVWVIAGSRLQVGGDGGIEPAVRVWRCHLTLPHRPTVDAFHAALVVAHPLQVRVPGARHTLEGLLRSCLADPAGLPGPAGRAAAGGTA